MPTIAIFYGIIVMMHWRDHEPPHFHARYGEHEALFNICPVAPREGYLPRRAERLVIEWAEQHQAELVENWERSKRRDALARIAPLE